MTKKHEPYITDEMFQTLYETLASIDKPEDMEVFLEDLCTRKEVENMAQRIRAAALLMSDMTYQDIIDDCQISSATLSRVSRCVQYGEGYQRFVKPLKPSGDDSPDDDLSEDKLSSDDSSDED